MKLLSAAMVLAALAAVFVWWLVTLDWAETQAADVAFVQAALKDNHPAALAGQDSAFMQWLDVGVSEARKHPAADRAAYINGLIAYAAGFGDTHVSIEPLFAPPPLRWPGFLAGLRDGRVVVVDRAVKDDTVPPLGAEIESCDGTRPQDLVKARVAPFGLDQRVPANRLRAVAELLLDKGNPLTPPLESCRVTTAGVARTWRLTYRDVPGDFAARFDATLFGAPALFGWREPADGILWIGLPSFSYDEANAKRLRKIVDRLATGVEHAKVGRAIVFDVRGNTGGSSLWADEIRNILWYPETVARFAPPDPSAVDWRASVGNRDHMLDLISEVIPKLGSHSPAGRNLTRIAGGLSDAVKQGTPFWREGNPTPPKGGGLTQRRPKGEKPLFPAKVIILSNGSCASACLDFADRILQMPGTYIVGFPTAGDGLYTESRSAMLPSGLAKLHFPMKVYRGRPRGDMEYYDVDARYDGPWTDKEVRRWLLALLDQGALDPPPEK